VKKIVNKKASRNVFVLFTKDTLGFVMAIFMMTMDYQKFKNCPKTKYSVASRKLLLWIPRDIQESISVEPTHDKAASFGVHITSRTAWVVRSVIYRHESGFLLKYRYRLHTSI
jgi:hypothetical protein